MENLVILDIGSNSVRMAINQIDADGGYKEIKRMKSDSRLSEGMGKDKILTRIAIKRTIDALTEFKQIYQAYSNLAVKVIATAAVRQARNQSEFLSAVHKTLDLHVNVLSGNQEAYYDYLGVVNQVQLKSYLLVDVGGASVELIRVKHGWKRSLVSLPIGAVNISERFHLNDRISAYDFFRASEYVKHLLMRVRWLSHNRHYPLVLLGGATRALARVNQRERSKSNVNELNNYYLNRYQVTNTFEKMLRMDLKHRRQITGLETDRADIIVGGLLPLIELMNHIDSRKVIFYDSGVREGLINEYINQRFHQNPKKRD